MSNFYFTSAFNYNYTNHIFHSVFQSTKDCISKIMPNDLKIKSNKNVCSYVGMYTQHEMIVFFRTPSRYYNQHKTTSES